MDEQSIVNRIKRFRKSSGLTLQNLADLTGFTKSYLSQIENSKKSPPVGTLTKIATALGVDPIVVLVGENESRHNTNISFVKKSERKKARVTNEHGYTYEPLAHKKTGKVFESYILTLPFESSLIFMHEGEEMIFVLEGKATIIYGEDKFIMEKGDCVHFNSGVPHTGFRLGDKKAKLLVVIHSHETSKGDDPGKSLILRPIVSG